MLLPALELLHKVVVTLGNLGKLGIHAALEVDKVLPRLESVARVLIPLADNLVEMSHRDLCHQGLLDRPTKYGLNSGVPALKSNVSK